MDRLYPKIIKSFEDVKTLCSRYGIKRVKIDEHLEKEKKWAECSNWEGWCINLNPKIFDKDFGLLYAKHISKMPSDWRKQIPCYIKIRSSHSLLLLILHEIGHYIYKHSLFDGLDLWLSAAPDIKAFCLKRKELLKKREIEAWRWAFEEYSKLFHMK